MHTWHASTGVRLSCNKILFFNSDEKTQSGQSENGLTFKCDFIESLCSRCTDVCDRSKLSRRNISDQNKSRVALLYTKVVFNFVQPPLQCTSLSRRSCS